MFLVKLEDQHTYNELAFNGYRVYRAGYINMHSQK